MTLAVGFFDGVHLGHRRILAGATAALTFRAHPATVFAPARAPALLMTSAARLATLRAVLGADHVRALDFTPALAAQTPAAFADGLRADYPDLDTIRCGANWTFGAGGAGGAAFLRARGFRVDVVPYVDVAGAPVSSTRIRAALAAGDCALAAALLGRPWSLEGTLFAGKGLGRKMGAPTLNVRPAEGLVQPPRGVYAVATPWGRGVANYGCAPTLGDRAWTASVLEVHLLDAAPGFAAPAPGTAVAIDLLRFIRPERTFPTLAALQAQIARDCAEALRLPR